MFGYITSAGKITITMMVVIFGFITFISFLDTGVHGTVNIVTADVATTSVTVLNTPPVWTVDAEEETESSGTSPTNAGSVVSFVGTATDGNNEDYYLLICKTSGAPTPNAGAEPTCNGGASNLWGVSASTTSGSEATASYTTQASDSESNDWYAWVCDANLGTPQCNATYKQGTGSTASPFVVNHRPTFTAFADDSGKDPGALVTWTTTASDGDTVGGNDTVKLFVCKENDFTGTDCGAGGTYATSTLSASDPTASFTLENIKQDKDYTAYGFIIDEHGFEATGGSQGTDSVLTVLNVAPTITSSSISLLDTDDVGPLTLTTEQGETTGFKATFNVADSNSCENSLGGDEISSAITNVFRSGIGSASCDSSGEYDPNNCYPEAVGSTVWNVSCSQDAGSCLGPTDSEAVWTCTFPLWYVADPTDAGTQYPSEDWLAAAQASDNDFATSTLVVADTGTEVQSFLAYSYDSGNISFGSLEPGQKNDPLDKTTQIGSTGNVGLDQTVYGLDMCTTFPTCTGDATSTIPIAEQHYDTASVAYAAGTALLADPGAELELNVAKTTSTSTPATGTTYWGINIPVAITLSGDYVGEDTIIGVVGEAVSW